MEKNEVDVTSTIREQGELEDKLAIDMNAAAIQIYNNELARLEMTYEKLDGLCMLMKAQQHAANEHTEKVCYNISRGVPKIELEDFAKRYGGPVKCIK